ncbi:hypothetical protein KQI77_04285 [Clostridium sp. MSJ-8]|uniref:hypothetical protein n=1 Tax=Clostridium sp. MSJ-8 TaxID=2841510 RepID=UPI001C0F23B8|nr:hypothetical protein [Clostridium sp. MSJ-8]MBU5487380.1 hypothetical protein [Clostridium sp. MSJ-8]
MNCYDLALEFLRTVTSIDELVDKKAKASAKEDKILNDKIEQLESRMFEIKNILKQKEV